MTDRFMTTVFSLSASLLLLVHESSVHADVIRFDMPPTAAATSDGDPTQVTFTLRMSSLIDSPSAPRVDQWLVTCRPRPLHSSVADASIVDYFPKTETASDVSSPIQVKESEENARSVGLHFDAAYPHWGGADAAAENGQKNSRSVQFNKTAAVQAVTAAGTIDRGRGVYFKLRWTATQVLEGEKQFQVTMQVPPQWRGSIVDVAVTADREEKKFGGLDHATVNLGSANFAVAIYRDGDSDAYSHAVRLADAEHEIRQLATITLNKPAPQSLPQMLRHVAAKFNSDTKVSDTRWLGQLVSGRADPHLDKEISRLPMKLRIAALAYADCRDDFAALTIHHRDAFDSADEVLVSKPVLMN